MTTIERFGRVSVLTLVVLGLGLGGCAQRLGAPGQAPPLASIPLKGDPMAVAQCTLSAMQEADECDSLDYGLGISTEEVTGAAKLTCYNVTPSAVAVGAAFGILGVLVGAAVGEKEEANENNKRPPLYTTVLKPVGPGDIEASFWVATTPDGPEYYIDKVKTYLVPCGGGVVAEATKAATPAATPVTAPTPTE